MIDSGRAGADARRERRRRRRDPLVPRRLRASSPGDAVLVQAAAQLTDPASSRRAASRNRGPADAPLFLINHWIDTSPAPKPSNAAKVNAHEALLDRVRAVRAAARPAREPDRGRLLPRGRPVRRGRRAQRRPVQTCSYGFGFTLNLNFAGDPSVLPAASVARTRNLCLASLTFFLNGELHGLSASCRACTRSSTRPSEDSNLNFALRLALLLRVLGDRRLGRGDVSAPPPPPPPPPPPLFRLGDPSSEVPPSVWVAPTNAGVGE